MIWLTWRQSRLESLIGGAALALVAALLLWTGHEMASSYHDAGLPTCVATQASDEGCWSAASAFLDRYGHLTSLASWLNLLPFLLGLLLAAPAVLDFEQGTYRLAWTQSVTRGRWLATKVGFGLATAVGVSAAVVALWTWWRGPFDALQGRFDGSAFDFEGTVPIAYTVFAFALCLTIGVVLRRTIPMIGIGLVGFLLARLGVLSELRPHYLHPVTLTWDPTAPAPAATGRFGDGSWVISRGFKIPGNSGQSVTDALRTCGAVGPQPKQILGGGGSEDAFNRCLHDHGVVYTLVYHPASRFWTFQAIETALFLGLAAALLALTVWWVVRRIA
jgi:hypothetical protein